MIEAFRNQAFKVHLEHVPISDWILRLKRRMVEWDSIMMRELGIVQLNRMYRHVKFLLAVENVFTFRDNAGSDRNVRHCM